MADGRGQRVAKHERRDAREREKERPRAPPAEAFPERRHEQVGGHLDQRAHRDAGLEGGGAEGVVRPRGRGFARRRIAPVRWRRAEEAGAHLV